MTAMTATAARTNFYNLIDQTRDCHELIIISGKRNNAVLISVDDWNAIQETLYLNSVSGLYDSLKKGMENSLEHCISENDVNW